MTTKKATKKAIWLCDAEWEALKKAAAHYGISASQYAREQCLGNPKPKINIFLKGEKPSFISKEDWKIIRRKAKEYSYDNALDYMRDASKGTIKNRAFMIAMTEEEWEDIKEKAKSDGVSATAYIKKMCLGGQMTPKEILVSVCEQVKEAPRRNKKIMEIMLPKVFSYHPAHPNWADELQFFFMEQKEAFFKEKLPFLYEDVDISDPQEVCDVYIELEKVYNSMCK